MYTKLGGPGPKMSNFNMAQNHILSVPIPLACYQFYVSKKELKKIDLFLPYGARNVKILFSTHDSAHDSLVTHYYMHV